MPIFTVQKHQARKLHYDFRLEMYDNLENKNHVLKSWAVPKKISLNPKIKRLAVLTEDHALEYSKFEGIIKEGYGKGKVIVWDYGTYEPMKKKDNIFRKISLDEFQEWFDKGIIEFKLNGKKLKGYFALVKLKNQDKNWLLIKLKDAYASEKEIQDNNSVISGKTIEEI